MPIKTQTMRSKQAKFYLTGAKAQLAMLKACKAAKKSIDLEQYIFEDDSLGRTFAAALIERANAGVAVRVLCDAVGSQTLFSSDLSIQMREAGIALQFFNPIEPWWFHKVLQWFLRDHRKILVIDGESGYTGGVGIEAAMANWRDTHVMVSGPVVAQMQQVFNHMWETARQGKKYLKSPQALTQVGDTRFVTNAPHRHQRFVYYEILGAIRKAQRYIFFTTPYFIPDRKLFRSLKRAVGRGVQVMLLVPRESDHTIVDLACQSYFWLTLRSGVRIYQYEPVMLHAKTIVIDDQWATVGSSNLDNLSLLLNYEDNIISTDSKFIAQLKSHFEQDLLQSREITVQAWHDRPLANKLLELLTWPLHRFM